jgi:hypothetical protein
MRRTLYAKRYIIVIIITMVVKQLEQQQPKEGRKICVLAAKSPQSDDGVFRGAFLALSVSRLTGRVASRRLSTKGEGMRGERRKAHNNTRKEE